MIDNKLSEKSYEELKQIADKIAKLWRLEYPIKNIDKHIKWIENGSKIYKQTTKFRRKK